MSKTYVIGDIHGNGLGLMQCLRQSYFDLDDDTLICLGDVCDGWEDTPLVIQTLFKIKNLILILGNHDVWLRDWLLCQHSIPLIWYNQDGKATIRAYERNDWLIDEHKTFFDRALPYYIDNDNRIFCHGSFDPNKNIEKQYPYDLYWDRDLAYSSLKDPQFKVDKYKEVYLGHTSIWSTSQVPYNGGNIWLLDTGGGYEGKLSIMDVDTKEYWQSSMSNSLYHNHNT